LINPRIAEVEDVIIPPQQPVSEVSMMSDLALRSPLSGYSISIICTNNLSVGLILYSLLQVFVLAKEIKMHFHSTPLLLICGLLSLAAAEAQFVPRNLNLVPRQTSMASSSTMTSSAAAASTTGSTVGEGGSGGEGASGGEEGSGGSSGGEGVGGAAGSVGAGSVGSVTATSTSGNAGAKPTGVWAMGIGAGAVGVVVGML